MPNENPPITWLPDASSVSLSRPMINALRKASSTLAVHPEHAAPRALLLAQGASRDEIDIVADLQHTDSLLDSWREVASWADALDATVKVVHDSAPDGARLFRFQATASRDRRGCRLIVVLRHTVYPGDDEYTLLSHLFADTQE